MADQISIQIAEPQVAAGSAVTATVNFRTRSTAAASTPGSIRYRVDCLTNKRNVVNWTSVAASSSVSISVPGTINGTIDSGNEFETRQLTVEMDTGLDTQLRQAATWRVRTIRNYVLEHAPLDSLLLEAHYPKDDDIESGLTIEHHQFPVGHRFRYLDTFDVLDAHYYRRTAAEVTAGVVPTNFQYAGNGSFPVVNVKRFGAVGDGTTDDTQAFLDALQIADVFVPYGTYKITSRLPLTQYGLIGEGWGTSGSAQKAQLVFYNQTSTTLGSIYTDYDSWEGRAIPIKNLSIVASSWDSSTGALGYGLDITARIDMDNVEVSKFGKSGIFLHNTDTDGEAPYNSVLKGVSCEYNGNHGLLVGTGANVITIIDYQGKWNGAPSFGTAPSVAGNYDGFHLERDNDGNPGSAYHSRLPESITIIGGDCSYNSRYGWNFVQCQSGHFFTNYCEGNLQATPGQVNLGNGLRECFGIFNGVQDETDEVNFGSQATFENLGHTNRFFVGGQDCGSGNSNTATSRYNYHTLHHWNWIAGDGDFTDSAVIRGGTDGIMRIQGFGAGGPIVRFKSYTVAGLPSASTEGAGATIYVSNETGGAVLAFSDGTNWRRVTDRAVVS